MQKGLFIVLEGADGSGKSTHVRLLKDYLQKKGHNIVLTAEPTEGSIGRQIRDVLSGKKQASPEKLTLMFTADRAEHIEKVINPGLQSGKTVICDRFYYSTIAYQSAQGVSEHWISEINSFVPDPDLVILIDVPPEEAVARMKHKEKEVFEVLDFQKKVHDKLISLAKGGNKELSKPGKSWVILSNLGDVGEVQDKIRQLVDDL
jgi:dTMP kinase